MKTNILLLLILISNASFKTTQNRIEILLNGVIQNNLSEPIRVNNSSDVVEMKIFFADSINKKKLINKVEVKGCKYEDPGFKQETGNNNIIKLYKPLLKSNYYSLKLRVNKITNCRGNNFSFSPLIPNNSPLYSFDGYQSTYNFYFVK